MAMATSTILALSALALTGASSGYQINEGINARREAKDEAGRREQEQAKMIGEQKAEQEKQEKAQKDEIARANKLAATSAARVNAAEFRKRTPGRTYSSDRSGTILTSPLGITGSQTPRVRKTLLGQ